MGNLNRRGRPAVQYALSHERDIAGFGVLLAAAVIGAYPEATKIAVAGSAWIWIQANLRSDWIRDCRDIGFEMVDGQPLGLREGELALLDPLNRIIARITPGS